MLCSYFGLEHYNGNGGNCGFIQGCAKEVGKREGTTIPDGYPIFFFFNFYSNYELHTIINKTNDFVLLGVTVKS